MPRLSVLDCHGSKALAMPAGERVHASYGSDNCCQNVAPICNTAIRHICLGHSHLPYFPAYGMKGVAVEFRSVNINRKRLCRQALKRAFFALRCSSARWRPFFRRWPPSARGNLRREWARSCRQCPRLCPSKPCQALTWSDTCMGSRTSGFGRFPLLLAIAETRIGGLPVPFDMGLKVGFMLNDIAPFSREDYFIVDGELRPEGE